MPKVLLLSCLLIIISSLIIVTGATAASNNPEIYSVTVDPSEGFASYDFSFVVQTNEYVDKVSITVDGYQIGSTNKFKGTNARTFTLSDIPLNSPGVGRVVNAYAYGSNDEVVTKSTTVTVSAIPSAQLVGTPVITSPSPDSVHFIGDTLTVKWNAPSTNPTNYNIFVHYAGKIVFEKRQHASTSITIPESIFQSVDSYSIEIYAYKKGYSEDAPGTVEITALNPIPQTEKPVNSEVVDLRTNGSKNVEPTPTATPSEGREIVDLIPTEISGTPMEIVDPRPDDKKEVTPTPQATSTSQATPTYQVTPTPQKTPTPQTTPTPQATQTQQQEQSPKVLEVFASPSSATVGSVFSVIAMTNNVVDMIGVEVDGEDLGKSVTFNTNGDWRSYSFTVTISEPNENCKISVYPYKNGAKVTNGGAYDIVSVTPKTEYTPSSVGFEPGYISPDRYNPPATTEIPTQLKEERGIGAFFNSIINWVKGLFTGKPEEKSNPQVYTPTPTPTITPTPTSTPVVKKTRELVYNAESYEDVEVLRNNEEREEALIAVMDKYKNEVASENKEIVIYFIEGYGSDLSVKGRSSALCVVVKNGKIVFANENCATLADQPLYPGTNEGNYVPNVIDGVYRAYAINHEVKNSDYPALKVENPKVVRITSNGISHVDSHKINIHKKIQKNIVGSTSNWANSAGCFLVGYCDGSRVSKEYDRFAYIVGFANDKDGDGYAETVNKKDEYISCGKCVVVVDRAYAYEHVDDFKNYMLKKYSNNYNAISNIMGVCYHTNMQDGLCSVCGYYDKNVITPYTRHISTGVTVQSPAYVNTQKSNPDGSSVFVTDEILVLGEYKNFYLIQYPVSNVYKIRFIEKEKVRME